MAASLSASIRLRGSPRPAFFTDPVATVERLSFRTGVFRERGFGGHDLPGADTKAALASFLIDDVVIAPVAESSK